MKKLLLTLFLLLSISCYAQQFDFKYKPVNPTPITDISVLTATTVYWMYSENPQADKIIHFLVGYFATNSMYQLLTISDAPIVIRIGTPILVWSTISFMKEAMFDGSPDWNDFKAGMLGCGLSAISFNISYTIKYKPHHKISFNTINY